MSALYPYRKASAGCATQGSVPKRSMVADRLVLVGSVPTIADGHLSPVADRITDGHGAPGRAGSSPDAVRYTELWRS
jgi:hypothetical protein